MASEKRLIDAEELWKKFEIEPWYDNADRDEIAMPMVDDAPTVDAVEVVHGRWIMLDPDRHGNEKPCCSVCNTYKLMAWSDHSRCNYCPNCGAKMDGGAR